MGVMNPGLVMRNIIPVVMAGVLGIYGLIVAVIIQGSIVAPQNGVSQYSLYTGFAHLAAGLCCGLSGLAAGMAIGIVGDAGVRAVGQQEKLFVGMILILIFAEALGLYGMYLGSGYTIVITKPEVAEEAFCEHVLDNGVQGQGLNTVDRASMQSHGGHHVPTMRIMTRDGQGLLEESKKKKKKNEGTLYFRYCNVIWKLLEKSAWKISCTHYQHQSSGKERSNDYGRSKLRLLGLESTMQKRGRLS